MANTRTDDVSLTVQETVVLKADDEIPEWRTEQEHVEALAEEHVKEQFNNPRGQMSVSVSKEEDFDSKTVYSAIVSVM